ncbi:hypothetical protein MMC25_003913 [Agyrium rufum]|nr:hypothetical protein [Agyrium rufum]
MADVPEKGDQVSWNYGGGKPSGEVAEKKTEGEIAIESKRGNTIKKKADPENPAIHISRPGNDVVKRQSELNVEEKKSNGTAEKFSSGAADESEDEETGDIESIEEQPIAAPANPEQPLANGTPKAGDKRAREEDDDDNEEEQDEEKDDADEDVEEEEANEAATPAKRGRGRPAGGAKKAAPVAKKAKTTVDGEPRKRGRPASTGATKKAEKKEVPAGDKKPRGRPKGSGTPASKAKPAAKATNGEAKKRGRPAASPRTKGTRSSTRNK